MVTDAGDHLLAPNAVVLFRAVELVNEFLLKECRVTRIIDLHLAHHLTNDDFEVLVIDLHTLQTINILHLIHDIFLNGCRALDGEDVTGSGDTVGQRCAGTHSIVFLHKNLLGQRHKILFLVTGFGSNDNLTVAALHLTHCHFTVDFGNNSRVGRIASLEEFRHTRQTTGDITGTTHSTRNLDQRLTRLDSLAVFHNHVTAYGEVVSTHNFTIGINDIAGRHERTVFGVGDDFLGQTGRFVSLGMVGLVTNDIVELQLTCIL